MKKNVLSIPLLLIIWISASMLSCTGSDDLFEVSVPAGGIILESKGTGSKLIEVSSGKQWSAKASKNWIRLEYAKEGLMIRADRNGTIYDREGMVTITSGRETENLKVIQERGKPRIITMTAEACMGEEIYEISANGKYVVGFGKNSSFMAEIPEEENVIKTSYIFPQIHRSVSNNGEVATWGITADGSVVTHRDNGKTWANGKAYTHPFIYRNGIKEDLPYPATDIAGQLYYQGNLPVAISVDGRYILDRHIMRLGEWVEAMWSLENGEYVLHYPPQDELKIVDGWPEKYPVLNKMSKNGKFTAGQYRSDVSDENLLPYVRDIDNHRQMTLLTDHKDKQVYAVSDLGHVFLAGKVSGGDEKERITEVYDIVTKTVEPFSDWMYNMYGLTDEQLTLTQTATVTCMSSDMSTIVWYGYEDGVKNYILRIE